jgi:hypothetical protein
MGVEGWSLGMTEFAGRWSALSAAVPDLFGQSGLDLFRLTLEADRYLPPELAGNLLATDAHRMAVSLGNPGARVKLRPTGDVSEVRFGEAERWPFRMVDGFGFT